MKIEKDKFYKTRAGNKVRIYATDGLNLYPVHGAVLLAGFWAPIQWTSLGKFYERGDADGDIISEWEEPKPKLKAWILACDDNPLSKQVYSIRFSEEAPYDRTKHWLRASWLDEK